MKISVVTISFNQAEFLPQCIASVKEQVGNWEHIIVDPGSTDQSKDIIRERASHFASIIFEPDSGPADGLNKGFKRAVGDIYYYLNSDDVVFPGTFDQVISFFEKYPEIDVLCGNGYIIDENGAKERRLFSDPISRHRLAHSGSILIQPATFIRRTAYEKTDGFNNKNFSNWDGELVVDLYLSGATFMRVPRFWAGYRLHKSSITASKKADHQIREWTARRYNLLMNKPKGWTTRLFHRYYQFERVIRHPEHIWARLIGKSVYGRESR